MALNFYSAYLNIASTPAESYREDLQEFSYSSFEDAGSIYTIKEELTSGTLTFTDLKCRVEHAINSETGLKLSDDFKKLIFKDFTHSTGIGYRYNFGGYIWIGINSDNINSATCSVTIRRCNNQMKWLNENNILFTEPCIFDYDLRDTSFNYDKQINNVEGDMKAFVQKNQYTSTLKINDRFIFNGQAYIINGINMHSIEQLLTINLFKVPVSNNDDLVNNIANAFNRESSTVINPIPTEIRIVPYQESIRLNDTQVYEVYNYINNVKQSDTFTFNLTGITNDGEYYEFTSIDGNSFSIKNIKKNYDNLLIVECVTGSESKSISVTLKGLW